jgi:hypothetical protein
MDAMRTFRTLAPAALALILSLGCGAGLTEPADAQSGDQTDTVNCEVEPTLTSLENVYFKGSCTFSSCHSETTQAGSLVLEPGKAFESLVGVSAFHGKAAGSGKIRVVAGDPDASFIVEKVEDINQDEGSIMPPGVPEPMDPDCRIKALRDWIAAGAPNN